MIEGYPRSANSFAVVAFRTAQPMPLWIAHHLHSEAQLIVAARRSVPALALIRDPAEAIRSFKFVQPDLDDARELEHWIRFYETVASLGEAVVVADFADATADFGAVTARVNARFGSRFGLFETHPASVAQVFAELESEQLQLGTAHYAGRPDPALADRKQSVEVTFDPARLAHAHALYRQLVG